MAYQFEAGEAVREAISRTSREQLERAVQELTDGLKVDRVEAIHEARKALKMERSLLRLARGTLPRGARRHANAQLRDTARRLSGARDADVMIEALDGLAKRYVGQVPESTFEALRTRLIAERDQLGAGGGEEIDRAVAELRTVREASAAWPLRRGGWKAIEPGLRQSYVRGRDAMAVAKHQTNSENLHAWRKRAKDLWYHLRLIGPAAPGLLDGHIEAAHALTNLLGDDHDLAVLRERLLGIAPEVAVDAGPVIVVLDHRRDELEREAWASGRRLYAERPKAFIARMHSYWKASRAQARDRHARQQPAELAERTRQAEVV